jgi:hypothetical protein
VDETDPRQPLPRWRQLAETSPVDLVLRITLLDLILAPIGTPAIRAAVLGLAVLALLYAPLLRKPGVWALLTLLAGLRVVLDWPLADNHAYLLGYWLLAISLALRSRNAERSLQISARWLIGLAFALATIWKLALSPDYLDGTFFRVSLLVDDRFEGLTRLLGGISADKLEWAREKLSAHHDGPGSGESIAASLGLAYHRLALFATIWTIAIEALIALFFLAPLRRRWEPCRDVTLLSFCATTYAFATVSGFGWLLVAMGIAQCARHRVVTRLCYVGAFLLILGYRELSLASWLAGR